jgi:hypothetical protein
MKYDEPIQIVSLRDEIRPSATINIFRSTISMYCSNDSNTDIKLWERHSGSIIIEKHIREIMKKT